MRGGPERILSSEVLIGDLRRDERFSYRLVAQGLAEIYRSGKYASMFIPDAEVTKRRAAVNAMQIAILVPGGKYKVVNFLPGESLENTIVLENRLRERLEEYQVKWELEDGDLDKARQAVEEQGMHVLGAFQIGRFEDGDVSAELIFPRIYGKIAPDITLATSYSAAFVRAGQLQM